MPCRLGTVWLPRLLFGLTLAVSAGLFLLVILAPLFDNGGVRPDGWSRVAAVFARDAVLRRCRGLDTPAARALNQREAEQFDRFVAQLAGSIEAAGIEVRRRPGSPHAWTVEPGNIGLNLPMLYAERQAPGFLEGLLARIRRWQSERRG